MYIGDLAASMDLEGLVGAGVTHVLNCAVASSRSGLCPAEWAPWARQGLVYGLLWSNDSATREGGVEEVQDPTAQWHAAGLLLDECRAKGGAVLVHCVA